LEYIVLCEVSRKQDYIFRSNKLTENVGASLIIKHLTEEMPRYFIAKFNGRKVLEGGGKSLYRFAKEEEAKGFIAHFSSMVLKEFPGIDLFMCYEPADFENENITNAIDRVYEKLAKKKSQRKYSGRQISYGIQRICESTGMPARSESKYDINNTTGNRRCLSAEVEVKLEYSGKSEEYFKGLIPKGYSYLKGFDELFGKKADKSYIAVVHIDGNRMGSKFDKFREIYEEPKGKDLKSHNEEYLKNLEKLSEDIKCCYEESFLEMCEEIVEKKELLLDETCIGRGLFPIRPLIVAGDDICFVTSAKIGIEASRIFIENLNKKYINIGGQKYQLNACAGVAIVKAHYPFARAYKLAEDLCNLCKSKLAKESSDKDYSLIDWHLEQGEISGSISQIRKELYNNGTLTMKPIYINNKDNWQNYKNFLKTLEKISLQEDGAPRSKIKALREVFRQGKDESEVFIKVNKLEKYVPPIDENYSDLNAYGFSKDGICMYYDAIEIMDLFMQLKGE